MVNKIANEFQAANRSLQTAVTSALTDVNPIAAEQLQIVIDVLDFYRQRAHLEHSRKLFEFRCYRALAQSISRLTGIGEAAVAHLRSTVADAETSVRTSGEDYGRLDGAVEEISEAISACVIAVSDSEVRLAVARAVLAGTRPLIDMQRSWFLPQGVDPDPHTVQPLDAFFNSSMVADFLTDIPKGM